MIQDPGNTFFPYNAVSLLNAIFGGLDPDVVVFNRRISEQSDPDQSFAVIPISWEPAGRPEMGVHEASIQRYQILVQAMIKDTSAERGLRIHSLVAKKIRETLARDSTLHQALGRLTTTDEHGVTESVTKFWIGNQVFHNKLTDGNWAYLSTLEFFFETQNAR